MSMLGIVTKQPTNLLTKCNITTIVISMPIGVPNNGSKNFFQGVTKKRKFNII